MDNQQHFANYLLHLSSGDTLPLKLMAEGTSPVRMAILEAVHGITVNDLTNQEIKKQGKHWTRVFEENFKPLSTVVADPGTPDSTYKFLHQTIHFTPPRDHLFSRYRLWANDERGELSLVFEFIVRYK